MEVFAFIMFLLLVSVQGLVFSDVSRFANGHIQGIVNDAGVKEASGLAASRVHANVLYTHNDKGGHPRIFALSSVNGSLFATFNIIGAHNYDWEDLAIGVCHNGVGSCLYIGDFGDHSGDGARNIIYSVREPATVQDQDINVQDQLHFVWNEEDTETLMVDPSGGMYIVSKVDFDTGAKPKIAHIPASAWGLGTSVHLTKIATLQNIQSTHSDPVGGDISPNGKEVLLKTKDDILYWEATSSDYIQLLQTPPMSLPYTHEHRGEAICWDRKGSGYYTLGEGTHQPLYYYSRHIIF